jgi:hypothetical protein
MNARRYNTLIAVATLVAAAPLRAQTTQPTAADFTKAALAEVRNAQGQIVLTGKFVVSDEDDDDVERKAPLAATSIDPDAAGEAEVELSGSGNTQRQEVEFSAKNLQAGAVYTFIIDGAVFATVTADAKGRAGLERDVPLPKPTGTK